MKLPTLALLAATLSLGACACLVQTASVSEAYKHYDLQDYDRTLELITRAENAGEPSTETRAGLTYLKAQTYEKLGQIDVAITLYEYLATEHSSSQYGYLAVKHLNSR